MQALRDTASIHGVIDSTVDPDFRSILTRHVRFVTQYDGHDLSAQFPVVIVEAGDTPEALEAVTGFTFVVAGHPEIPPLFETLEEYPNFYKVLFLVPEGDRMGVAVFVPKRSGIDPEILAVCSRHATPAPELTP